MSIEMINYLFENFKEFQQAVISSEFFYNQSKLDFYTVDLVFLYDKNKNYKIDKQKAMYDMNFALKKFMTEDEIKELLSKDYTKLELNKEMLIKLSNQDIILKPFNYVNGNNGSGKTRILKDISKSIKVPMFSMENTGLNLEEYIKNEEQLKKYLYQLTGTYEVNKYSNYQNYAYRLAQILEYSKEQGSLVLLDDLRWQSLDSRNEINLIATLSDYSLDTTGVVITGHNKSSLIKNRVYKANIIEL